MKNKSVVFGHAKLDGIVSDGGKRGPIIVSHGSGRGLDAPILEKTADKLAQAGFYVLRFNFGYMGKRPAPSAGGKNEKPEMVEAIEFVKKIGNPIIIGKSFGGRVASYVASERSDIAGLVFYGLPLHGMAKNAKPRDWSHMAKLTARTLFVTGDKDKLCNLEHLTEVQALMKVPFESEVVPGDHSFKPKSEDAAIQICCDWVEKNF